MGPAKLTQEGLEALVASETYFTHGTLTLCVLDLVNGSQVVGQSNVMDPGRYDAALGRRFAREQAVDRLWELEGYAVKTRGR